MKTRRRKKIFRKRHKNTKKHKEIFTSNKELND